MTNRYMDEALMRSRLEQEGHRAIVGGLWDVIGPLQRDFLIAQGLGRSDKVLDIGCGALRGGAPLTAWLDPGHYYGIDISPSLLEAGWTREIQAAGLADRLPRANLHATDDFEAPFGVEFDIGLAVSLFTHLPLAQFTHALERLRPRFRSGARLFASVFEGQGQVTQPRGVISFDDRDPFHFTQAALAGATPEGWAFRWIGDWDHPRDQRMAELTRV